MPALGNSQHEKFAQLVAADKTAREAYAMAGFSPDAANARKLAIRPAIAARISELQAVALDRTGVSAERITDAMAAIAFFEPGSALPDGTIENGVSLTPEAMRAASHLEMIVDGKGRRRITKIKIDRLGALEALARWQGLDRKASTSVDVSVSVDTTSPAERIRLMLGNIATKIDRDLDPCQMSDAERLSALIYGQGPASPPLIEHQQNEAA